MCRCNCSGTASTAAASAWRCCWRPFFRWSEFSFIEDGSWQWLKRNAPLPVQCAIDSDSGPRWRVCISLGSRTKAGRKERKSLQLVFGWTTIVSKNIVCAVLQFWTFMSISSLRQVDIYVVTICSEDPRQSIEWRQPRCQRAMTTQPWRSNLKRKVTKKHASSGRWVWVVPQPSTECHLSISSTSGGLYGYTIG